MEGVYRVEEQEAVLSAREAVGEQLRRQTEEKKKTIPQGIEMNELLVFPKHLFSRI